MSSSYCCVLSCRKRLERNKRNISSFSFPNDTKRKNQWINAIQKVQKNWVPSAFNKICSDHFKKTDFILNDKTQELLLKTTAIPCIFTKESPRQKDKLSSKEPPAKMRKTAHTSPIVKHENDLVYQSDEHDGVQAADGGQVIIEEYIMDGDPLIDETDYKYEGLASKFYGQEEASDSDGGSVHEDMYSGEQTDTSLTLKLSKLISEENISSSCAEKLLSILKQHGHAELPKKTIELVQPEPEFEEQDQMSKLLDYVVAETKDIEAKMQFKLNFLSKCLNRIECKVSAMSTRPMSHEPINELFSGLGNIFPITTMEQLMDIEDKFSGEDENVEAKVKAMLNTQPNNWMKHMFADDIMENFSISKAQTDNNLFNLNIIKCVEKYVTRGEIVHQKRQCKDRYSKTKQRQKKKQLHSTIIEYLHNSEDTTST
ncbi:hypothetical protein DMENIID0001_152180 [Sergentomyia squamirostris]